MSLSSSEKPRRPAWMSLAEVSLFYFLVLVGMWGGARVRPPILLIALLMLGICFFSNWFHRDSLEKIGLASKNFRPNLMRILPFAGFFLILLVVLGWGKPHPAEGWDFWFAVLGYPVWGFVQDYVLLGFIANRLEEGLPMVPQLIPWINGFLFSMAHIPNPMLMCVTMLAGTLFTWIFLKDRHLIPLALTHALFGIGISIAFGDIPGIMSVGPAYLLRIGK